MTTINAINAPLPLAASQGGTGLATLTAHGILVGEGTSAVTPIVLTNGQVLIGSTGANPAAAAITAGAGITVTPGAGSLTIAATGSGLPWTDVTGTAQAMAVNNGYIADNAGLVTLTLPASAAIGDEVIVLGKGAGGWVIAQNANQAIHFGNQVTTTGVGGSLVSTNQWDNIMLRCVTAGASTIWTVTSSQGNITVV